MGTHELEVIEGSARGAVSCGGFHPVDMKLAADSAKFDFVSVLKVAILKDDFDFLAGIVGKFGEHSDFIANIIPL